MEADQIKTGTCYQLANGQIIRVMSIFGAQVRYDVFDETEKKSIQSGTQLPVAMLKEQKTCPVPAEGNAKR